MSNDVAANKRTCPCSIAASMTCANVAAERLRATLGEPQHESPAAQPARRHHHDVHSIRSRNTTRSRMDCVSADSTSPTGDAALYRPHRHPSRHGHDDDAPLSDGLAGTGGPAVLPRHRRAIRRAYAGAGTSRRTAARSLGVDDEVLDLDAVDDATTADDSLTNENALLAAMNASRTGADGRHRRDDPGRAGPDHPLRATTASSSCRAAPAPARPRSRCTGPRTCSTRTAPNSPTGRADRRPEHDVPALHRPGAARPRRERGRARHHRRPVPRRRRDGRGHRRGRRDQGPRRDGRRPAPRGRRPPAGARRRRGRSRSTATCCASTGRSSSGSATGSAARGCRTTRRDPIFVRDMVDALARQVADRIGADVLGGPNLLTAADLATIRDELRERHR